MVDFIETPRFPEDISYGSGGGPGFRTTIFMGHGSREARGVAWDIAKHQYNIAMGIRDISDMATVAAFHYTCRGRAVGFRFKDWADFELTQASIGTGDGVTLAFKLTKKYTIGAETYTRRIFKPVPTSIDPDAPFIVRVNGVVKTVTTHYTVDFVQGIITFTGGNAPPNGQIVDVTCYFDVPVRFDNDVLAMIHDGFQTQSISAIPIVEVPLDDLFPVSISGVGSSLGTGAAVAVGAPIAAGTGVSAGVGAAPGVGVPTGGGVGASAGVGSAPGVGASTAAATGTSAGVGAAPGVGTTV